MGRNILQPRESIKPWVYPQLLEYKDSIRHAYWIHTEYNLKPDVQDYKVNTNDVERGTLTRAILGVSQIEVKVKRFWGDLFTYIPQFEIDHVGATFADSEVRHFDALVYSISII